ncbi:hypothetical protein OEZ86_008599 [Tetradesmus obliquus]|nr:hypothetical protein OEZ86_008599 [Tetradesmus obliquus]
MEAQQLTKNNSAAKKKQKGNKTGGKASSKALWGSAQGWKQLDAADELLLGAEEGGFAGLEVLEDVSLLDADLLASLNGQAKQSFDTDAAAAGSKHGKQSKKQQQQQQQEKAAPGSGSKRKRGDAAADAAGAADADVAALKARLKKLEAENKALKKQKKQPAAVAAAAGSADAAAAAPAAAAAADGELARKSRKELRAEKKKQYKLERQQRLREQREQAKAAKKQQREQQQQQPGTQQDAAAAAAADVDMSGWMRFSLHPKLEAALAAQGFSSPTPIQDAVLLPAIRDRRDVIGAAQTGSGKTLAFGLPILQVLLQEQELLQLQQGHDAAAGNAAAADAAGEAADGDDEEAVEGGKQQQQQSSPLRALILAPTRELALQVAEHLQALGKHVGIRVAALVGGIAPVKQERLLRSCPPVVVATPGRLWDLMRHGHKHVSELDQLSFFVLDEADRMVQQVGFEVSATCTNIR